MCGWREMGISCQSGSWILRRAPKIEPSLGLNFEVNGAQRCCAPTGVRRVGYAGGMNRSEDAPKPSMQVGLCAECVNARRVESERGSVFVMCQLSLKDANYPKYPRLPVLSCAG